jgi:hypothetical protein
MHELGLIVMYLGVVASSSWVAAAMFVALESPFLSAGGWIPLARAVPAQT